MISKKIIDRFKLDSDNKTDIATFKASIRKNHALSKSLEFSIGSVIYKRGEEAIESIWPKINMSKMRLTKEAKVFLNNAKRGNAFVGIGDMETGKLYVHPLYKDNDRSVPVNDPNDLTNYSGPFPKNCFAYNKYISHSVVAVVNMDKAEASKVLQEFGGTSHQQLLQLISKKSTNIMTSNFHPRYFGFSIFHNGGKNDRILGDNGKVKASLRIASNSINTFFNIIKIFNENDNKYIKFPDTMTGDDWSREHILLKLKTSSRCLPIEESLILSKNIADDLDENDLKNSLKQTNKNSW